MNYSHAVLRVKKISILWNTPLENNLVQPLSIRRWTSTFLDVHRLCSACVMLAVDGVAERDLPGKNHPKYWAMAGKRTRAWRGPDTFILPLATMTRATGSTDSEIHSFSHWLPWPGHGEDRQWDTFILSLSYHDSGMERTDSEIHASSHWAIVTRAWRGQTVRYIHSPTEQSWLGHGEDRQ